jgi:hypothetical protein
LSLEKHYDNPNVENKVFRKIEKVFRLYFGENGAVYPKFRRFIFAVG